jgi:hypothetical protein
MRKLCSGLGLLFAMAMMVGCGNKPDFLRGRPEILRPQKNPEEYNTPSSTDPRYNLPPETPKEVLNQDNLKGRPGDPSNTGTPGGFKGPGGRIGGPGQ